MTGLVLCGGKSVRMGSDKAALPLFGRTLLERAAATLAPITRETLLACGPAERYGDLGLALVLDACQDGGPLAGLEAGLARAETEWIAAIACDMPRVDARVLEALLDRAIRDDLDACLLASRGGVEPLCAVYRRTCLVPIRSALASGERQVVSFLRFATRAGGTPRVGVLAEDELPADLRGRDLARNLNTPADLTAERAARSLA